MATLTLNCHVCGKPAKIQSQFEALGLVHYIYQCGHLEAKSNTFEDARKEENTEKEELISSLEKSLEAAASQKEIDYEVERMLNEGNVIYPPIPPKIAPEFWALEECKPYYCKECKEYHNKEHAYAFQREGIAFIERALPVYGGCLIADEMGLGKTIQASLTFRKHMTAMAPALFVVKGGTLLQWFHHTQKWVSEKVSAAMPVTDRMHLIPGFKSYIISMDLLGAKGVVDAIQKLGIKAIIIDEVQNFKDRDSLRTRSLIKIIKACPQKPLILALSGTPIKNKATEYFTILNLLDPRTFYSYAGFCRTWLYKDERGFYTRLETFMIDRFNTVTSKYILRRKKSDVLKELPELIRDFQYIDIEDPQVKASYNQNVDLLKNFLNTAERVDSNSLLGWFARMRAITGSAKVPHAIEWCQDFCESTEENIAIGIHHKAVRDFLFDTFTRRGIAPLKLSGEDNVFQKNEVQRAFNNLENRMLIINMLAGGVGLNLQACSNTLILELPWNPADLEQFIGRFHRNGQTKVVTATTLLAKGTIDEFMYKLIYEKSVISSQMGINIAPHDNIEELMHNPTFLREFAEFLSNHKI